VDRLDEFVRMGVFERLLLLADRLGEFVRMGVFERLLFLADRLGEFVRMGVFERLLLLADRLGEFVRMGVFERLLFPVGRLLFWSSCGVFFPSNCKFSSFFCIASACFVSRFTRSRRLFCVSFLRSLFLESSSVLESVLELDPEFVILYCELESVTAFGRSLSLSGIGCDNSLLRFIFVVSSVLLGWSLRSSLSSSASFSWFGISFFGGSSVVSL
jgi:hypothetical protein